MQAIQTTYHGPTNTRGARIVARCDAGRLSVPWDYSVDGPLNHYQAAYALARKLGWIDSLRIESGALPSGAYAHVFVPEGK